MKNYKYQWMEVGITRPLAVVGNAISIHRLSLIMSQNKIISGRILNEDSSLINREEFFGDVNELIGFRKTTFKKPIIGFNIWDDYYDDGYVPEGEIQETYGYLEGWKGTQEDKEKVIKIIYDYLMILSLPGIKVSYDDEIYFQYLTHERRETLVEELEKSNLEWKGTKITFYSES